MTTDELKIVFHERYSLPYRSPRRESKLHRSAASSRMDRHDGNNRSNYYVIVDLFRVRRNGGGGGRGEKNEVDDQQPRRWPQEEQRCAVAFT